MSRSLANRLVVLSLLGGVLPLAAQGGADSQEPIDRVAAVVGNVAITYTQLQEEFYTRYTFQNKQAPTDPEVIRKEMRGMIDTLIDDELIYQQAIKDTLVEVRPIEVSDAVDQLMRKTRAQASSEEAFQAELRSAGFLNIEDYRRWLLIKQTRESYKTQFVSLLQNKGVLDPIEPTETEVRKYYDDNRDRMANLPVTFNIKQILIRPEPNATEKAKALKLADSLVVALRGGADFATVARRFSQDPGSAAQGGSMGWQRRGKFVPSFEKVAFSLPPGTVSEPVESPYGYHIIQVQRTSPTERLIRHILISPPVDSSGIARAREQAENIRQLIISGLSFDSLQKAHSDPAEARVVRGVVLDSVPQAYQDAINNANGKGVSPVFEVSIPNQPLLSKFGILLIADRFPAGPPQYDLVREKIRIGLGESMARERYLKDLRKKTYIDIREL